MLKKIFGEMKSELHLRGRDESQLQKTYLEAKYSETTFEFIETLLGSLNLCVSPSALANICQVQKLEGSQKLLDFICKDFLTNLPRVFNESLSLLSARSGL